MSRRRSCHDNAVAESYINLLKRERIRRRTYRTHKQARQVKACVDGIQGAGVLTVSKVSDVLIIAGHTHVPDSMCGRGVTAALAEHPVAEARRKGRRIVLLYPFVPPQALRHPDWGDVIQR